MLQFSLERQEPGADQATAITIKVAVELKDMLFKQYVNYVDCITNWPEWLRTYSQLPQDKQIEAFANFAPVRMADYWLKMTEIVSCFTTPDNAFYDLLELPINNQGEELQASIAYLSSTIINNISTFTPDKNFKTFKHRGYTYHVPAAEEVIIGELKQVTPGANVKTLQVVEALQRAQIFAGKDANGNFVLKDHKYHSDIAMVACMCRREEADGLLEELPLGEDVYASFIHQRVRELESLNAEDALSVCFFLTSSYMQLSSTLLSKLSLKLENRNTQKARRRQKP